MTSVETWDQIYERQRATLVSYATMLVGSRAVAEDVVQDCIVRLLGASPYRIDKPAAYLRTAVVNGCKRELRVFKRSVHLDPDHLRPWIDQPDIELLDAIERLTPRRRNAVLLRYYLDLPVTEVAELMGCKPSSVSSLLNRAYRDLKECLP